jgi:hypothetical protein
MEGDAETGRQHKRMRWNSKDVVCRMPYARKGGIRVVISDRKMEKGMRGGCTRQRRSVYTYMCENGAYMYKTTYRHKDGG